MSLLSTSWFDIECESTYNTILFWAVKELILILIYAVLRTFSVLSVLGDVNVNLHGVLVKLSVSDRNRLLMGVSSKSRSLSTIIVLTVE